MQNPHFCIRMTFCLMEAGRIETDFLKENRDNRAGHNAFQNGSFLEKLTGFLSFYIIVASRKTYSCCRKIRQRKGELLL